MITSEHSTSSNAAASVSAPSLLDIVILNNKIIIEHNLIDDLQRMSSIHFNPVTHFHPMTAIDNEIRADVQRFWDRIYFMINLLQTSTEKTYYSKASQRTRRINGADRNEPEAPRRGALS